MVMKIIKKIKLKREINRPYHGRSYIVFPKSSRGMIFDSLDEIDESLRSEAKEYFERAKANGGTVAQLEFQFVVLYPDEFERYETVHEIDTIDPLDNEYRKERDEM